MPEYVSISTFKIQAKIKENGGLDVENKWQEILCKHFPTSNEKEEVLRTKNWPVAFLEDCALLRVQIEEAVEKIFMQEQGLDQLFRSSGLDALLGDVMKQKERLMVRSTGREDTKELANAGGNTSVPNVIPDKENVLQGMKDVVTSYFGEKSLKQRLGVGDPTLFDEIPFTPVLVQRMIGERDPNALPKCGVMFTEDCQSKIGTSNVNQPTSGITVIQAAYGHNEGVVSSLIPVDSYYVNQQHTIIPIIRPKTHRMMPTENSGELKLVANNSRPAVNPSLSPDAVISLKKFAEKLEEYYGGPMDVEFVVDEVKNTVYIVQARPLVERKFNEAMYIQNQSQLEGEILKGSTIGAAGGSLLSKTFSNRD